MPKINVYLPDDLAEGVKSTGIPVSAICQRALEQSVRRVSAIRAVALTDLTELADRDPTTQLTQFTERARTVLMLAIEQARQSRAGSVGTEHLLHGLLIEGASLALHVLRTMEVPPAAVLSALTDATEAGAADPRDGGAGGFSAAAANALELTVTEAIGLGHNYVGCEHLLLGLLGEPDGTAGAVLRELNVDPRAARRTVTAALAGYLHPRAATGGEPPASRPEPTGATDLSAMLAIVRAELRPLVQRIERLEHDSDQPVDGA